VTIVESKESVAIRFGFTGFLFTLAFVTGLADAAQNHRFTPLRIVFLVVVGFLGAFFIYTWWNVKRGSDL